MTKRPSGALKLKACLVSDTHVNEAEDQSASPYPANAQANPRARHIFAQINAIDPALVIHLGDMINPVPELPSYAPAAENFQKLASTLNAPLYLMPGNHDIGDKPVKWMPAGMVNPEFSQLYRDTFGRDFFAVEENGIHFVMLNSPLVNSGQPEEAEQAAWFEAYLESNAGARIFVFTHYPPYINSTDEPSSYDNYEEPGRTWFLDLIRKYQPEAVFAAHVHNFWYDRIGETEYYVTPSTCFVRHDYSEMYRIDGGSQKGRNDTAKLGFLTLEIFENGHVAKYHRSYGQGMAEGAAAPAAPPQHPHVKTTAHDRLFVDLRRGWAEEMVIAPSGGVDEFQRKVARNDYPVMAMWEMGLRGLRVPLHDLTDERVRRRMALMVDVGHTFQVYLYGMPNPAQLEVLKAHSDLVDRLELVLNWEDVTSLEDEIRALHEGTGCKIILSRVNRKDGAKHSGKQFNHLISHGFTTQEIGELKSLMAAAPGLVDGFQFTIMREDDPWAKAKALNDFAADSGAHVTLYVKSTGASPAEAFLDEEANTERFVKTAMASFAFDIDIVLDTLEDADRGYFTRTGLIDRRFNPRIAAIALSELVQAADGMEWKADFDRQTLTGPGGVSLSVQALVDAARKQYCPQE